MSQTKKIRDRKIIFRVNDDEYEIIEKHFNATPYKYLGTYIRKILLQKPVTIKYRNQSADEILTELIDLQRELNAIGNNFNQAVKKLHLTYDAPGMKEWIISYQSMHDAFLKKIEEINSGIIQLTRKW